MTEIRINNLYRATEGEGIFIGTPQIFVRFQGCATACINCDSKETWDFSLGEPHTIATLMPKIEKFGIKRVSITGGDPLHPQNELAVLTLVKELKRLGYFVNIEASGVRLVESIFDLVDFISADYKTPSTGVIVPFNVFQSIVKKYSHKMQIKSVVESEYDFHRIVEVRALIGDFKVPWVITPAYTPGKEFSLDFVRKVIAMNEEIERPFRLIAQQHKWLFGVDRKDV